MHYIYIRSMLDPTVISPIKVTGQNGGFPRKLIGYYSLFFKSSPAGTWHISTSWSSVGEADDDQGLHGWHSSRITSRPKKRIGTQIQPRRDCMLTITPTV
jgi:hypothetical protein